MAKPKQPEEDPVVEDVDDDDSDDSDDDGPPDRECCFLMCFYNLLASTRETRLSVCSLVSSILRFPDCTWVLATVEEADGTGRGKQSKMEKKSR